MKTQIKSVTYIVMVYGYWAKGETLKDAITRLSDIVKNKNDRVSLHIVLNDPSAQIDSVGYILYGGKRNRSAIHVPIGFIGTIRSVARFAS